MSRTKNAIKNIYTGITYQIIYTLLSFVTRTIFIYALSTEYLGINGLFSNILTMLSLAELGIGSAIIYSLYKPVAENNEKKISKLMNFYRLSYRFIGVLVLIIGILLLPFLDNLITTNKNIPHLKVIYLLYLSSTVSTYFFAYKRSLLIASQKLHILNRIDSVVTVLLNVAQIAFLLLTHNFIIYLILQIIFSYSKNIVSAIYTDKKYPYLKKYKHLKLDIHEKKEILKNVKAMLYHKVGGVVLNATDNLIISKFISIVTVGIYSNYTMLINSVSAFLTQCFTSLTAGVGNLLVIDSKEKAFRVFKEMFLINFWLYSLCCICLVNLINPFIFIWIGKNYLLQTSTMVLVVINFYLVGMRQTVNIFKTTRGLFYKDRYKPIFECILNIGFSIYFVQKLGVFGVLLGTFLSFMLTSFWVDPFLVYRDIFNMKLRHYFTRYILYTILAVILCIGIWLMADNLLPKHMYVNLILRLIISLTIPNIVYLIIFHKLDEFQGLKKIIINVLK